MHMDACCVHPYAAMSRPELTRMANDGVGAVIVVEHAVLDLNVCLHRQ